MLYQYVSYTEMGLGGVDSSSLVFSASNSASFRIGNAGGGAWWHGGRPNVASSVQCKGLPIESTEVWLHAGIPLSGKTCNLAGDGDCVKERACKKTQHRTTINKIPPTMTKQMGMQKINNPIQQVTSTPHVCSGAEQNGGGKTCSRWWTAGMAFSWQCQRCRLPPPPPLSSWACLMLNCTRGRAPSTPPPYPASIPHPLLLYHPPSSCCNSWLSYFLSTSFRCAPFLLSCHPGCLSHCLLSSFCCVTFEASHRASWVLHCLLLCPPLC